MNIKFKNFALFFLSIFISSCCDKEEIIVQNNDLVSLHELEKEIVSINTTNVATGFETVFMESISDSAGRAELCQAFIGPTRFLNDKSGYFFVESYNAWMVAHATKPELIGTYRFNVEDSKGKLYVQEMVNTIKYTGFGFVEYYFDNPESGLEEQKLAFVKSIPAAGFFIGSGIYGQASEEYYYRSEANKGIVVETTRTFAQGIGGALENYYSDSLAGVNFCRELIDHVRFFDNQSGYFFIYDFNCVNVAHGTQKDLQGQNLYDYQDSHGNYVIRDLVAVAKDYEFGYYEYWWNNPVSSKEEMKLAWVMKVPGIDYFIGSGVYMEP
jgi:signal transduction histidine kinase